jgi:uncharacterized membrane protein
LDVLPRNHRPAKAARTEERVAHPVVSWIAITVGVFLIAIGILLLLWGLSWQGASEDDDPVDPDTAKGGPALLPLGVFVIAVGIIWVLNGYRVFGRSRRAESTSCPRCGRLVETDLAFCYHCGAEVPEDRPLPERRPRRG